MIVVDVGCARYGADYSIERLIEEFHPEILYGFDPGYTGELLFEQDGCTVTVSREAAWTYDGRVAFEIAGLSGGVRDSGVTVPCVDLARFLLELPECEEVALKMDAESAEYTLLEHLLDTGADARLKLLWCEWHPRGKRVNARPDARREAIEQRLHCEVHQWNY